MNSRSLPSALLAVATAATLAACTTEAEPTGPAAAPNPTLPPITTVEDAAAVLEVEDQTSEGPTVRIKAAAVTAGGFVVVSSDGGRNILGSSNVPASATPATLQVSLAEEITEQTDLVAQLYNDEDGNGLFSAPDRPVSNGEDDEDDDVEVFAGELETFTFTGKPVVNS